jgi:hypothetical protein
MKSKLAIAVLAAAAGLLLSACIGIESNVTFKNDGSGVFKMEYRIAKSIASLGKEAAGQLPLPVNEDELRQAIEGAKGLNLVGVSRREDDTDIFVAAEIGFDRVESLSSVDAFGDMPMSLERAGNDFVFRQVISPGKPAGTEGAAATEGSSEADKEMAGMLGALFEGYELVFVVTAPRPIKNNSAGDLAADRKSVTYRLPLTRLMELAQETTLTVTW